MNVEEVVAMRKVICQTNLSLFQKMILTNLVRIEQSDTGELSLMPLLKTNNQLVASVLQECTPSLQKTILNLANGSVRNVKVVAITPSQVVLMVYNSPVTTAPTRTRSTTNRETSTASATIATTVGTRPMTKTTTPTSRSSIKKVKAIE